MRYDPAVTPFAAVSDVDDPAAWGDLATITQGQAVAMFATEPRQVPRGWAQDLHLECLQLIETERVVRSAQRDPEIVDLSADDVPGMLDLVDRTRPGPFLDRTIDLGGYVGIRDSSGRLMAMAGRRLASGGWCEVSAVCTDPAWRGRGCARRLIEAVVDGIHADQENAFLHVTAGNPAITIYEAMGFELRRRIDIVVVRKDG